MTMLVTGGAGFIGSNFIRHMLAEHPDTRIVNLDALTYAGNPESLRDVADNPNYTFVRATSATPARSRPSFRTTRSRPSSTSPRRATSTARSPTAPPLCGRMSSGPSPCSITL
jgi:hypothetical protein